MDKNCCSIVEADRPRDGLVRKAIELFLGVWSGSDPGALAAIAKPCPAPILHRLPDLRRFGPSIR